jgi:hypothetical protein
MTKTIANHVDEIRAHAIEHTAEARFARTIKPGQFASQGDVDLVCIGDADFEKLRVKQVMASGGVVQLAPGTSQGSRHTVRLSESVQVWSRTDPGTFDGPLIRATERFVVEHPEHADWSLPGGCYRIDYQEDRASRSRVLD